MRGGRAWKSWPVPSTPTTLRKWQAGRCAMCGHEDRLVRDHCHMTGFVRGLLCSGCNTTEDYASPDWKAWREGDTPARALGFVEVYEGPRGTPLHSSSPLNYYSLAERLAWWDECIRAGVLPIEAPWTAAARARKTVEQESDRRALQRVSELLFPPGSGWSRERSAS